MATAVDGVPELVIDGENGYLAPPKEPRLRSVEDSGSAVISRGISAFCWVKAPARENGAVVPAVGQGRGPKGIPFRAISTIELTSPVGKVSGLTGDTLIVRTFSTGPITSAILVMYSTSCAV